MSPELRQALDEAERAYQAMTPEQKADMWRAQRESWVRGMAPCEHGVADFEECTDCRSA